jgi:hypothetical protein
MAHGKMSGQIFISYRRDESRWSARSLYDRLAARFDRTHIFIDIDAIALGEDFLKAIENKVGECDVLIAIIGPLWMTSTDGQGGRRLDNPEDFVRMEIATALSRNIRVIPVLMDGALMPQSTDLPDDLKSLVRRNALQIGDTHFDDDCRRLVAAIEQVLEKNTATPREGEEKKRLEHEPQSQISSTVAPSKHPAKPEADKLSAERVYPPSQKRPSKPVIVFLTIAAVLVVSGLVYLITIRWHESPSPHLTLGRATFITSQPGSTQALAAYLKDNGAEVSVVGSEQANDIAASTPDIIIVGADTRDVWQKQSSSMLAKLFENYKVIAIGVGGASLFSQLGLTIGESIMHANETRLEIETPDLLLSPFKVPAENKTVQIYQPSNKADVIGAYDGGSPAVGGFEGIARWEESRNHWPISRQGNYLLWGFNAPSGNLTEAGRQLFVNLYVNHQKRAPVPLSQARSKITYIGPGVISERLSKQFPRQNWSFKVPRPGRLSAQLSWNPPGRSLALILNGTVANQRTHFERKDGSSPLMVVSDVTEEDIVRDTAWKIDVTCFEDLESTIVDFSLDLSFPQ